MARADLLFAQHDWFSVSEHQQNRLKEEVASYDGNRLLNTSVDDLCDYFEKKYSVEVPQLDIESIVADQRETKVDVSHRFDYGPRMDGRPNLVAGSTVEIAIPFTGDAEAFKIQPTQYSLSPPRATVRGQTLILEFTGINQASAQVKAEIDRQIQSIQEYLGTLQIDASTLNSRLRGIAQQAIESRRQKLLANQNLVASLGFRVKERSDAPATFAAPQVRRKIVPRQPAASTAPFKPEPCLPIEDYDHILNVVQNMAHVMERSPSAFVSLDEEGLRTHFLVQLNGHFEGQATGETFNYEGKTDILIRVDGKNVFIGECKFWGGPKKLTETIDQVLGYSSWRDSKVAVIIFNRNKDFSKVLAAIQSTVSEHPNCKKFLSAESETVFRYRFAHRDDANREMTLAVLAFDVPSA